MAVVVQDDLVKEQLDLFGKPIVSPDFLLLLIDAHVFRYKYYGRSQFPAIMVELDKKLV